MTTPLQLVYRTSSTAVVCASKCNSKTAPGLVVVASGPGGDLAQAAC